MAGATVWKIDADKGRRTLHLSGSKAVIATIEREGEGPMWRAVFKGGVRSDLGNITRITDAALSHAAGLQRSQGTAASLDASSLAD